MDKISDNEFMQFVCRECVNHSVPNVFGKSTVIGHLTFVSEEVRKEDFGGRGVADVFSLVIESFFRMESLCVGFGGLDSDGLWKPCIVIS